MASILDSNGESLNTEVEVLPGDPILGFLEPFPSSELVEQPMNTESEEKRKQAKKLFMQKAEELKRYPQHHEKQTLPPGARDFIESMRKAAQDRQEFRGASSD